MRRAVRMCDVLMPGWNGTLSLVISGLAVLVLGLV